VWLAASALSVLRRRDHVTVILRSGISTSARTAGSGSNPEAGDTAVCVALAVAAPTSPTTSPKSLTPRFFSDDRLLNNRSRVLGTVNPACGISVGGGLLRSRRGASKARRNCGTASGVGAREVAARETACCSACDSSCDLRVASASTLRIASSSARRSFVICASKSAGWFERSCATSALRARSYSARRASPVLMSSTSTARAMSG
jgi:hypothetical protein